MSEVQERIASTTKASIFAVQAVNLPFDDMSHASISELMPHLDAVHVLSHTLAARRMYPAIDPLLSTSHLMNANIIGDEHYFTARRVLETLQEYKSLEEVIAILGADELSEADQLTVARARRLQMLLTQPFSVAEKYTGRKGKFVSLQKTIESFKSVLSGECDSMSEEVFYMIGPIADALEADDMRRWMMPESPSVRIGNSRERHGDADYVAEYASFRAREDEVQKAAKASGLLYDTAGAIERFRLEMRINDVDAEMDAFMQSGQAGTPKPWA